MKAYLIIGNNCNLKDFSFAKDSFIVGVDRGALKASENGIELDLAYGDFDSVSESEMEVISRHSKKIIKLLPEKDITDTEGALNLTKNYDQTVILGAIQGKRIEHFLAVINLMRHYPKAVLEDDDSFIFTLGSSKEASLVLKSQYKYISFFALEDGEITLTGFKYPLCDYTLKTYDSLCISNEIIGEEGRVMVKRGSILAIQSKDDHFFK
jgi:thiamine pyrophosphokinase